MNDRPKNPRTRGALSYLPIALAVGGIFALAAIAAITTNESHEQVERGEAHKNADNRR